MNEDFWLGIGCVEDCVEDFTARQQFNINNSQTVTSSKITSFNNLDPSRLELLYTHNFQIDAVVLLIDDLWIKIPAKNFDFQAAFLNGGNDMMWTATFPVPAILPWLPLLLHHLRDSIINPSFRIFFFQVIAWAYMLLCLEAMDTGQWAGGFPWQYICKLWDPSSVPYWNSDIVYQTNP